MAERSLFASGDLGEVLDAAQQAVARDVASASEQYLLNVDLDEWVTFLVAEHRLEPISLRSEDLYLEDLGEVQVDVRFDSRARAIYDMSQPAYVSGRAAKLHIPFSGDAELFDLRPRSYTYNPPHAGIEGREVVFTREWPTDTERPDLKAEADALVRSLEQWCSSSRAQVEAHNRELENVARTAIRDRRNRVLADHAHLEGVGLPVYRRDDAPETFAAPGVTRRQPPTAGARGEAPRAPEPTMIEELYEHTLGLIRAWGHAIERTPAPYVDADEETLRDALLPMLNSHYEGAATGETFNASGKTDILIRVDDRTIFIGECKWWKGPAGVDEALEQLFSYATWRDTKLALIFFVDRRDPVAVVEKVRELLPQRETFLEWGTNAEEYELRCEMSWPDDSSIRAQLHVFFIHLRDGSSQ